MIAYSSIFLLRCRLVAVKNISVAAGDGASFPVQRHHVTQLIPFTNYTFAVRAGNKLNDVIAWGDWSEATSVVTDTARKITDTNSAVRRCRDVSSNKFDLVSTTRAVYLRLWFAQSDKHSDSPGDVNGVVKINAIRCVISIVTPFNIETYLALCQRKHSVLA